MAALEEVPAAVDEARQVAAYEAREAARIESRTRGFRRAAAHHDELRRLRAEHPKWSGMWLERDPREVESLNAWEATL